MRILYTLLLVGVTMVWGWTFVVVQDAIALYGVLGFLAARFALAASALAPYTAHRVSRRTLVVGEVAPAIVRERSKQKKGDVPQ